MGSGDLGEKFTPTFVHGAEARENSKVWIKNKRPRNEGKKGNEHKGNEKSTATKNILAYSGKGKNTTHGGSTHGANNTQVADPSSHKSLKDVDKGYDILTIMDVEALGPNRLRFTENPEPPDPCNYICEPKQVGDDTQVTPRGVASDDLEDEMVEGTPCMLQG